MCGLSAESSLKLLPPLQYSSLEAKAVFTIFLVLSFSQAFMEKKIPLFSKISKLLATK